MKRVAFLLAMGLAWTLAATMASADRTDCPWNCECTLDDIGRLYLCPDGLGDCPAGDFCVIVRNCANSPINNAVVEILVGSQWDGYVGLCPDQTVITNTNVDGEACFNIAGGGCYKHQPDAISIRANGVTIREYNAVMSSDYAAWDDEGTPYMWDHLVNPLDLAAFVTAYQGGTGPPSCHDYNNNDATDPPDLAVFVQAYKGGQNRCP